jgi:myo-inositol-1(or 4)-monophosphatase
MRASELSRLLDGAIDAAHAAGELLASYFGRLGAAHIRAKSSPVDLASRADDEAEHLLVRKLKNVMPTAGFVGEESADGGFPATSHCWVVDPLDGTSNYLAGLPIWSVSIALCTDELAPLLSVVHAPLLGLTWTGRRGGGAWVDGRRMHVRRDPPGGGLGNAMIATGFPYDVQVSRRGTNIGYFARMQRRFHKIRRLGSAAIDLAYVAQGVLDGMWELKLMPWDTAAGALLIREAGGVVERIRGGAYTPGDGDLLAAATPELLALMRSVLAGGR